MACVIRHRYPDGRWGEVPFGDEEGEAAEAVDLFNRLTDEGVAAAIEPPHDAARFLLNAGFTHWPAELWEAAEEYRPAGMERAGWDRMIATAALSAGHGLVETAQALSEKWS